MRTIVVILIAALGCNVSDDTLTRVCEANGLTDVRPGGWAPFSCGKDDDLKTHFTAKAADGRAVSGTVCCGYFMKDCTVRWE